MFSEGIESSRILKSIEINGNTDTKWVNPLDTAGEVRR